MIGKALHQAEPIPEAAMKALQELMQSGDLFRYTAAENAPVTLLEQDFARLLGSRFALAVSSCSAALFLSIKALGLPRDARVLIPGFTFAAVPSAVVHAECQPVLVEIGENYRIDMEDFAAKLDDSIQAVIISHMRGHTSDMDAIMALCEARQIPVIEDAAHSLGTTWNGQNIGTIGAIGCFSFQSYKLVNGGEGGILITDDEELIAKAVIMSGAYENNWQKHQCTSSYFETWQNQLPLYNTRMSNLSAVVIRPQLDQVARRAKDGLANHDRLAAALNTSPFLDVPPCLAPEKRAPDSIQFNLVDFSRDEAKKFMALSKDAGLPVSIFGLHEENARVFWNWNFIQEPQELPQTRKVLMRACDVRLPAALRPEQIDEIRDILLETVVAVKSAQQHAAQ